jgi:2-C-methyl-D-erythritol 4-phosphate cytidylyltransferase
VDVSDEAMAMELAGFSPLLVEGAEDNIKVTTAADFALAQFLLARTSS